MKLENFLHFASKSNDPAPFGGSSTADPTAVHHVLIGCVKTQFAPSSCFAPTPARVAGTIRTSTGRGPTPMVDDALRQAQSTPLFLLLGAWLERCTERIAKDSQPYEDPLSDRRIGQQPSSPGASHRQAMASKNGNTSCVGCTYLPSYFGGSGFYVSCSSP